MQTLQGVHGDGERQGLGVDPEPGQVLPKAPPERDAEAGEGGGEPEEAGHDLQLRLLLRRVQDQRGVQGPEGGGPGGQVDYQGKDF